MELAKVMSDLGERLEEEEVNPCISISTFTNILIFVCILIFVSNLRPYIQWMSLIENVIFLLLLLWHSANHLNDKKNQLEVFVLDFLSGPFRSQLDLNLDSPSCCQTGSYSNFEEIFIVSWETNRILFKHSPFQQSPLKSGGNSQTMFNNMPY